MIIDLLPVLNRRRIVLASASPRRMELLRALGLRCDAVPSAFAEDLAKTDFPSPAAYATENARRKALDVWGRLGGAGVDAVIGADTVIALDGRIVEKPADAADARRILAQLSGRTHVAVTGVAVAWRGGVVLAAEETAVDFAQVPDAAIAAYVATGSPLDKAGAYGIQDGVGGSFVRAIRGDYSNVVGLPVHRLCCVLRPIALEWQAQDAAAETALPDALRVLVLHNDVAESTEESEKDVLEQVAQLVPPLQALGVPHTVVPVANPRTIGAVLAAHPDCSVVWNFYEPTVADFDPHSMLGEALPLACDLFGKGCTGGTTYGLALTLDKALSKRVFRAEGVPVARDVEVSLKTTEAEFTRLYEAEFGSDRAARILVKPTCADASEGIVWNKSIFPKGAPAADVWRRVDELRKTMFMPVLVEELVGAGELNVSVLEDGAGPDGSSSTPRVLAVAEMDFSMLPPECPPIVDWEGKWDPKSVMWGSTRRIPANISAAAQAEVERVALLAWKATGCRDFGRVDMRFDTLPDGGIQLWVLEVNLNPDVSPGSGFLAAVEYAGLSFQDFVRITLKNAFARSSFAQRQQQKKTVGKLN